MTLALVGDIGGTNARFALADIGGDRPRVLETRACRVADHAEPLDAVDAFLEAAGERPDCSVLAVAGPVKDGEVSLTNAGWTLKEDGLRAHGLRHARLINDFAAQAWAAPLLGDADRVSLGGPAEGEPRSTLAALGPGTGFGLSAWVDDGEREAVAATEGGHVAFAPSDEVEIEILRRLTVVHGRVSVERILSGPGLLALHHVLAEIDGRAPAFDQPDAVTEAALRGDAEAARTVERFAAILGSVAGDIALGLGALGGVYVTGGIPPVIAPFLQDGGFRRRFEDKGRFRDYVAAIPTWLVTREHPALLGAAHAAWKLRRGA